MSSFGSQDALPFDAGGVAEGRKPNEDVPFAAALLGLAGVKGLGRVGVKALVRHFGDDLVEVWDCGVSDLRRLLEDARVPSADGVAGRIAGSAAELLKRGRAESQALGRKRTFVVGPSEIPERLRHVPDPPAWLFVQGRGNALQHRPAVAVVGTRKASERGRRAARLVAELLAAYPITLVSGLAEGIDEEAHEASLGEGARNLAFLGHGIDVVFPASTAAIRQQIVRQGGDLVSEYLPGERYRKPYFVERNRLQAALADVVIPVEGQASGGTAHTFRFARQYGQDVAGIRLNGSPGGAANGAEGLLGEIEKYGYPAYDVSAPADLKKLDRFFRALAEEHNDDTFALSLVARRIKSEFRSRDVRPEDVERLEDELDRTVRGTRDVRDD